VELVGEDEGNAVRPRQAEPGRVLAGADVRLDFLGLQRMAHVAHGRFGLVSSLQLEVLIDGETQRRIAQHQP
jgi:hypothetical protein